MIQKSELWQHRHNEREGARINGIKGRSFPFLIQPDGWCIYCHSGTKERQAHEAGYS